MTGRWNDNNIQPATENTIADFMQDPVEATAFVGSNIDYLPNGQQQFAGNLVTNFAKFNHFSPKQLPYIAGFWSWLKDRTSEDVKLAVKQEPKKEPWNTAEIVTLFKTALASKLYKPSFRYNCNQEEVAAVSFKCIMLFYAANYEAISIWGEIANEGRQLFMASITMSRLDTGIVTIANMFQHQDKTLKLLKKLIENPIEMTAKKGREGINCCFCGLHLTDSVSRAMGYGPICADKWGLPYGHVDVKLEDI